MHQNARRITRYTLVVRKSALLTSSHVCTHRLAVCTPAYISKKSFTSNISRHRAATHSISALSGSSHQQLQLCLPSQSAGRKLHPLRRSNGGRTIQRLHKSVGYPDSAIQRLHKFVDYISRETGNRNNSCYRAATHVASSHIDAE